MIQTIIVTDKEFAKCEDFFKSVADFNIISSPTDEKDLANAIISNNCRAVIIGIDKYVGPLYAALGETGGSRGAIIARYGVGHDGVDKQLAQNHNILVTNTPGVLDVSVAEHAIWLMGTLARNIAVCDHEMRNGIFDGKMGIELHGKTLVIVGFGFIGKRVARIASYGLDMRVIAADVLEQSDSKIEELKRNFGIIEYMTDIDDALAKADIISIHMPSIPATHHFFNANRLAKIKPSAMFINTARGPLVDENALFDALSVLKLKGAALDVYETEPYTPVNPGKDLRTLGNVILTPHIGSNTRESNNRIGDKCITNIRCFFEGQIDEQACIVSAQQ